MKTIINTPANQLRILSDRKRDANMRPAYALLHVSERKWMIIRRKASVTDDVRHMQYSEWEAVDNERMSHAKAIDKLVALRVQEEATNDHALTNTP